MLSVDVERRIVDLTPSPAGRAPRFTGGGAELHTRVRQEMKHVYESIEVPSFLDGRAKALLEEGRAFYAGYGLPKMPLVEFDTKVALFCWVGDRILNTLLVQLRELDLPVERDGVAIVVNEIGPEALASHIRTLVSQGPADAAELAGTVANKLTEKYHPFMNDWLLSIDYASGQLDTEGAWQTAVKVLAQIDKEFGGRQGAPNQ